MRQSSMNAGRFLVLAGIVLIALGLLVIVANRLNLPFGRLPGDVVWRGRHTTVYFPWVTCLLLSALATLLLWLFGRRP
ncbi:MAG: DUF2905 domain-containing protein [Acidobacteriaceae bacterium]|nr:DUF2905 domain-containing protein [Acidobacteriaceae bacterium]